MPKWLKPDPYETYVDGNCRNLSGQIVNCADPTAVSPAKFPPEEDEAEAGVAPATDDDE